MADPTYRALARSLRMRREHIEARIVSLEASVRGTLKPAGVGVRTNRRASQDSSRTTSIQRPLGAKDRPLNRCDGRRCLMHLAVSEATMWSMTDNKVKRPLL